MVIMQLRCIMTPPHYSRRWCVPPLTMDIKMKRKGQMEIMGLVVIIILLAIGMLFTVSYMINRKPSEAKKTYTESQMASNILSAILKTSTPQDKIDPLYCDRADFTELLQDCATFETIYCYNSGMGSCRYAEYYISYMLNKTLGQYNKAYRFKAWVVGAPSGETIIPTIINEQCDDAFIGSGRRYEAGRKTKLSPIPLNPGTLMVQFDICS